MQHKNADTFVLLENFITDFWDSNGVSPTTKEIADGTGLSTATVCRYLQQMRKDGSAVRYGHRGVRTSKQIHSDEMLTVPLLGEVACGLPTLAVENIVEYIKLPVSLFGKGNFYLLRAKGDSIIEVGVEEGVPVVHAVVGGLVGYSVWHLRRLAQVEQGEVQVLLLPVAGGALVFRHAFYQCGLLLGGLLALRPVGAFLAFRYGVHLGLGGVLDGHIGIHGAVGLTPLHLDRSGRKPGVALDGEAAATVYAEVAHRRLAVLPQQCIHAALPLPPAGESVAAAVQTRRVDHRRLVAEMLSYVQHAVGGTVEAEGEAILLGLNAAHAEHQGQYQYGVSHRFLLSELS